MQKIITLYLKIWTHLQASRTLYEVLLYCIVLSLIAVQKSEWTSYFTLSEFAIYPRWESRAYDRERHVSGASSHLTLRQLPSPHPYLSWPNDQLASDE